MFRLETLDTGVVLRVRTELDSSNGGHLTALVTSIANDGTTMVTIDLRGCAYISAAIISLLVRLSRLHPHGFEVIVAPTGAVHRIFEVCGFLNGGTFVRVCHVMDGLGEVREG
jgi:anti-anti-sigma factor